MTKLLIQLFIGNGDCGDPKIRKKYGLLSGIVGIVLNLFLFTGKLIAGILSGAVSVVADALNNLSDAGSSIVNIVGFKIALSPPDREHPFGHGRAEYISGLVISFVIMLMGIELAKESFIKILNPQKLQISLLSVIILTASVAVKLWMFIFNRSLGKKIASVSLNAAATDSISDVVTTLTVVLGIFTEIFFEINIDAFIGLLVAAFIVFSGVKTAKESLSPLLGQMPDKMLVESVRDMVCAYDGIIGIHDLIIHNYGVGISFISFHAEMSSKTELLEAHTLIDKIEEDVKERFGCCVTVHIDPVDTDDEETMKFKETVCGIVSEIDKCLSIHDFRVVKNPLGCSLIFDLTAPYAFCLSDAQLREMLIKYINEREDSVSVIVNVERQLAEI